MTFVDTLSGYLVQLWFSKQSFLQFRQDVSALVESLKKMADLLKTKNIHQKGINATSHPIRQVESNTEITKKEGSSNKVATVYLDLDEKVRKLHPYEPLHLTEYEPEQRYMRRH